MTRMYEQANEPNPNSQSRSPYIETEIDPRKPRPLSQFHKRNPGIYESLDGRKPRNPQQEAYSSQIRLTSMVNEARALVRLHQGERRYYREALTEVLRERETLTTALAGFNVTRPCPECGGPIELDREANCVRCALDAINVEQRKLLNEFANVAGQQADRIRDLASEVAKLEQQLEVAQQINSRLATYKHTAEREIARLSGKSIEHSFGGVETNEDLQAQHNEATIIELAQQIEREQAAKARAREAGEFDAVSIAELMDRPTVKIAPQVEQRSGYAEVEQRSGYAEVEQRSGYANNEQIESEPNSRLDLADPGDYSADAQ